MVLSTSRFFYASDMVRAGSLADTRSLVDLLILHISGQLNGEINKTPDAVDEGIAPALHRHMAKKDRQLRKATSGAERGRRVFHAISAAARQKSPESFRAQLARCGTRELHTTSSLSMHSA